MTPGIEHGSEPGFRAHLRAGERACIPCLDAHNVYTRGRRPKRAPRELSPCGTPAAYRRHIRHGQAACEACLEAHSGQWSPEYAANRRAKRRAAA